MALANRIFHNLHRIFCFSTLAVTKWHVRFEITTLLIASSKSSASRFVLLFSCCNKRSVRIQTASAFESDSLIQNLHPPLKFAD